MTSNRIAAATLSIGMLSVISSAARCPLPYAILHAQGVAGAIPDPEGLTIEVTEAKRDFHPLEPIELAITATNTSDKGIVFSPRYYDDHQNFFIEARYLSTRDPIPVPHTQYHAMMVEGPGLGGKASFRMDPGEKIKTKLVANLVSDMTAPGKYSIVVGAKYWTTDQGFKPPAKVARSRPVEVKVGGAVIGAKE